MSFETALHVDVVTVPRSAIALFGGQPWASVVADALKGENGLKAPITIKHGYAAQQMNRPDWQPPMSIDPKNARPPIPLPYLPLDHAWLREIDGRAFLYLQNW